MKTSFSLTTLLFALAFFSLISNGIFTANAQSNQAPMADFSATTTTDCSPIMVQFMDKSMGNPRMWEWDVDNDGKTDYSTQNPMHTFKRPGTYWVKLKVSNDWGQNVKMKNISVTVKSNFTVASTASSPQNKNDGRITVMAMGGKAPYMYRLNDGMPQTSNQFMNLTSGNYKVHAMDANNCMAMTEVMLVDKGMCMMPTGVQVMNIGRNMATVNWMNNSSAMNYTVWYRESGMMNWMNGTTMDNRFTLVNLMPAKMYEVKVQARCSNGMSESSALVSFMTMNPMCDMPTASVDHVMATSAWVNWKWSATAMNGYTVYYRPMGMPEWKDMWVGNMEKMAMLSNLMPNTSYEIKVKAMCGTGNWMESPMLMFRTKMGDMNCMPVMNLMAKPMMTEATIMWDAVSGSNGYMVYWKMKNETNWMSMSTTMNWVMPRSLMPGAMYDVMVKTMCGSMMSEPMMTSFMTMNKPMCDMPMPQVDNVMATSAWVKWLPSASAKNGYTVYYRAEGMTEWMSVWVESMTKMVMLKNLMPDMNYEVKAVAMCGMDNWSESSVMMFRTMKENMPSCMPVMNLKTKAMDDEAMIMWDMVDGASGYMVYWKMSNQTEWMSMSTTLNWVTATNLMPSMMYDVMVKTMCGSMMSEPMMTSFRTMNRVMCEGPELFWVDNLMMNSANVSWLSSKTVSQGYTVYYRPMGMMNWMSVWAPAMQKMTTLSNLMPNMTYEVMIETMCSKTNKVSSPVKMFTTPMACMPVMNLMAKPMKMEAQIMWKPVMGATGYWVAWRMKNDFNWMTTMVNTNMFMAKNLMPGMMYEVMVKTSCGSMMSESMMVSFMTMMAKEEGISGVEQSVSVYPNPNKGNFTIQLGDQAETGTTLLTLRDLASKAVWTYSHTNITGNNNINVEGLNVPAGIYVLEIAGTSGNRFVKLIIH